MNSIIPFFNINNFTLPAQLTPIRDRLGPRGSTVLALISLLMTLALVVVIKQPQFLSSLLGRVKRPIPPPATENLPLSNHKPVEFDLSPLEKTLDVRIERDFRGTPFPGLNMLGICRQDGCKNKDQLVLVPKGLIPHKPLYICKECLETCCPACQRNMDDQDVNDILITETFFLIKAFTSRGEVMGNYGIHKGKLIRINVQKLKYLHLTLTPLEVTLSKL